jgi:LPS export ABC transporter protein LptC
VKRTTYIVVVCAVIVLLGVLVYFNKDEGVTPPPEAVAEKSTPANVVFEGSSLVERKDGKKLWELSAETINVDSATKNVYFNNFNGTFYDANGRELKLTAQEAFFDSTTKDLVMQGEIKATSSDGAVFTAPKARWMGKEGRIYASGGITLTQGDTVITGDEIESDSSLAKVKIQGNAHAIKGGEI